MLVNQGKLVMSLPMQDIQAHQHTNPQELAHAASIILKEQGYPVDKIACSQA